MWHVRPARENTRKMRVPLLKLLTPRNKTYIQCPQFKDWSDASVFGFLHQIEAQRKGELRMAGEDVDTLKGGEPKKKKKGKKKAAKKKATKK